MVEDDCSFIDSFNEYFFEDLLLLSAPVLHTRDTAKKTTDMALTTMNLPV